ncbi:hypothetical protein DH2020_025526 [Rehmannia glutinosa]|uniref:PPM-type phosphatase domain-containing protein n=1 Tax=Rehmannia glutinosa TaxID=99300 RepID=A0ABR0VZH0_REHGL
MDVMNFELMAEQASLFSDSEMKNSNNSLDGDNEDCSFGDSGSEVSFTVVLGPGETRSGVSSVLAMTSEDDGSSSLEGDPILDSSCSLSVVSDTSSLCGDDLIGFETNSEIGTSFLEVDKSVFDVELIKTSNATVFGDSLSVAVGIGEDIVSDGVSLKSSAVDIQSEKGLISGRASRSIFEVDYLCLYGVLRLCVLMMRLEESQSRTYCSETVGSTAVVAIVCSSHIIVANCGDSRAVLCRGKEPMALSVDHKPNREDEYARIEAAGGKVIQWNGHRVFGVLAMSRSIGDRYLKPWIIPDPEVMFVPRAREDECLILASDGLWDVMTNEEVCDIARKRILLWHKNNGVTLPLERGEGIDPAAQAAAEYLSNRALQKGSKDNISVVVVDLKAQRKIKSRT